MQKTEERILAAQLQSNLERKKNQIMDDNQQFDPWDKNMDTTDYGDALMLVTFVETVAYDKIVNSEDDDPNNTQDYEKVEKECGAEVENGSKEKAKKAIKEENVRKRLGPPRWWDCSGQGQGAGKYEEQSWT